ncbi:hypothetical protein Ddc_09707 [Ditylenchus destructor]|nr:hypothetical protein Ddc_09707 [Ditylenchus destructor]
MGELPNSRGQIFVGYSTDLTTTIIQSKGHPKVHWIVGYERRWMAPVGAIRGYTHNRVIIVSSSVIVLYASRRGKAVIGSRSLIPRLPPPVPGLPFPK